MKTFQAAISYKSYGKQYCYLFEGQNEDFSDDFATKFAGVYTITAPSYREARHKARLMFAPSITIFNGKL